MRLTGSSKVYLISVERVRNRVLITWDEMKNKLKEKYFPDSYRHRLLDELHHFRKESMSVQAYITAFDDLILNCELQEEPHQIISRYHSGLRTDIQWAMIIHSKTIKTFAQASQLRI